VSSPLGSVVVVLRRRRAAWSRYQLPHGPARRTSHACRPAMKWPGPTGHRIRGGRWTPRHWLASGLGDGPLGGACQADRPTSHRTVSPHGAGGCRGVGGLTAAADPAAQKVWHAAGVSARRGRIGRGGGRPGRSPLPLPPTPAGRVRCGRLPGPLGRRPVPLPPGRPSAGYRPARRCRTRTVPVGRYRALSRPGPRRRWRMPHTRGRHLELLTAWEVRKGICRHRGLLHGWPRHRACPAAAGVWESAAPAPEPSRVAPEPSALGPAPGGPRRPPPPRCTPPSPRRAAR